MNIYKKFFLLLNTVKYLKLSQIWFRLLKIIKKRFNFITLPRVSDFESSNIHSPNLLIELDFDKDFLNRFCVEGIVGSNRFCFLNETREIDLENSWKDEELSHLWRFNLHYFEYVYSLADKYISLQDERYYEKFKELIQAWIKNNECGIGDGWHPYTISLRLYNWICGYILFKDKINQEEYFKKSYINSLFLQYNYLKKNKEKDILGNHYFENLKAICIGSVFFNFDEDFKWVIEEITIQLDKQVLEDGMHFELSTMYHKVVYEDLLKIAYLIKGKTGTIPRQIKNKMQGMLDFMYSIEIDTDATPLFNDAGDNVAKSMIQLVEVSKKYFDIEPNIKEAFDKSGYYILKRNGKKIIIDAGKISPDYLPSHGHCDVLSFELYKDGKPLIVNSGTYKYAKGPWRDYFRSTKAHNTLVINNYEQSQCWDGFRVARRVKCCKGSIHTQDGLKYFKGTYKNYKGYGHIRVICFIEDDILIVLDKVQKPIFKKGATNVNNYIHFTPELKLQKLNRWELECNNKLAASIHLISDSKKSIFHDKASFGWYSPQFGLKYENYFLDIGFISNKEVFGYAICFTDVDNIVIENGSIEISREGVVKSYDLKKIITRNK